VQAKEEENRPVTQFKDQPVYRGKGRFGPFLKWGDLFINIPRKFDPEKLTEAEMHGLIADKVEKENKKYIKTWNEEDIQILNGRWGPYIKFGKENVKFDKLEDGSKVTEEHAARLSLEEVKAIIVKNIPDAFTGKKKTATTKKAKGASKRTASTSRKTSAKSTDQKTAIKKSISSSPLLRKKKK